MYKKFLSFLIISTVLLSTGCVTTQQGAVEGDRIDVGTVQREISIGMSGSDVAGILGSPNIVTTDELRREVWIYDKISQEVRYDRTGSYGTLILIGASSESGGASRSTKTLTVIIKYDKDGKVRDFAYHTSRF